MTKVSESLEVLDGPWSGLSWDTGLTAKVARLRRQPLQSLGVEDLRMLIGQEVGLAHLIPLALDVLEANPLAEGALYPGDLLSNVLAAQVWIAEHDTLWERLLRVVANALKEPCLLEPSYLPLYQRLGQFAQDQFSD